MGSLPKGNYTIGDISSKYAEERDKRLRPEGLDQYADLRDFEKYHHLADDPWCHETGERQWTIPAGVPEARCRVVIVGTGYAGLTYATRFLTDGNMKPEDILFVDNAAGFGGAWYWNRYPGLMCDIESLCYMPLLEETGYIPKHRYAYGPELRAYAEQIASHWHLQNRALWRSTATSATWDDSGEEWVLKVQKQCRDGTTLSLDLRADFFVLAAGLLHNPKLPKLPGIQDYAGHAFHTARWDYACTGGSPENPTLSELADKTVMFVGTGATAIQAVPQLARWARQLLVVQRTPAAVDSRGQRPIERSQFQREIGSQKGWQRRRRENLAACISNANPELNLVQDGWTTFPSYSALVGSPKATGLTNMLSVDDYVRTLHAMDLPRQERIRARVDEIVRNKETAESLKPWYSGWCKRPCFHDEYLPAFNQDNVQLIDTKGRGIDAFNETGIVCGDVQYDADVVIFGTGFEPWTSGKSPSERAGFKIIGRKGIDLDQKWHRGIETLHGFLTRGFPNMFISAVNQTGATANYGHMADLMATHAAQIITTAEQRNDSKNATRETRLVIEPTAAGEEAWTRKILANAHAYAGFGGCIPSYTTAEGQAGRTKTPEAALKEAKGMNWGLGVLDFTRTIEAWRADGQLEGLEVQFV